MLKTSNFDVDISVHSSKLYNLKIWDDPILLKILLVLYQNSWILVLRLPLNDMAPCACTQIGTANTV